MSRFNCWAAKVRGEYKVNVRGIKGKLPKGLDLHEYARVANNIRKRTGILHRRDVQNMLKRPISFREYDQFVRKLREDGRLAGYEINPDVPVVRLTHRYLG